MSSVLWAQVLCRTVFAVRVAKNDVSVLKRRTVEKSRWVLAFLSSRLGAVAIFDLKLTKAQYVN